MIPGDDSVQILFTIDFKLTYHACLRLNCRFVCYIDTKDENVVSQVEIQNMMKQKKLKNLKTYLKLIPKT